MEGKLGREKPALHPQILASPAKTVGQPAQSRARRAPAWLHGHPSTQLRRRCPLCAQQKPRWTHIHPTSTPHIHLPAGEGSAWVRNPPAGGGARQRGSIWATSGTGRGNLWEKGGGPGVQGGCGPLAQQAGGRGPHCPAGSSTKSR